MNNYIMERLGDKEWVQKALIEVIGDIWMLLLGLIGGAIVKIFLIGF